ncbi:MAG: SCO1664 family protein [Anaerolineales bacterium]|nr:SCO1664 family protein [Anaerolineales bacterium]
MDEHQDPKPTVVSVERIMRLLREGRILEEHGRLRWSSNYTTVVSVEDDEMQILAIYKPQRGERPLWDFPTGTLCYREVAAYEVSQLLGWGLVAPTVLRDGPKGIGSLQFYIDHDPEINYFNLSDDFVPQLKVLAAFDVLLNNTDRKGGHCLVDARGKIWGIDHGICFHTEPKLRTVIWDFAGQAIEDDLLADIRGLHDSLCNPDEPAYQLLIELLNRQEVEALRARAKRLVDRKSYPRPGPGPNHPWPPV